jgi:microcompartment protein CcmL/EutN
MAAGLVTAKDALIDHLFLPNPHPQLEQVLEAPRTVSEGAVAIIETYSIAATIRAADAALKAAEVNARRIRLADEIGGKGYFIFVGELHDVEAAMLAAETAAGDGLLAGSEIIANPHPDLFVSLG